MELSLCSPVALGSLPYGPTLDTVLMALLAFPGDRRRRVSDAMVGELSELVAVEDGVPCVSALRPTGGQIDKLYVTHPRVPNRNEIFLYSKPSGSATKVGYENGKTVYATKFTHLDLVYSPKWVWSGVGNLDRLRELLCDHPLSIGARRGSGYGAVTKAVVKPSPRPTWLTHGIGVRKLSRPVPLDRLDSLLAADGVTRQELDPESYSIVPLAAWPAPSWSGRNPVPTAVPVLNGVAVPLHEQQGVTR